LDLAVVEVAGVWEAVAGVGEAVAGVEEAVTKVYQASSWGPPTFIVKPSLNGILYLPTDLKWEVWVFIRLG
jgi:hypothetical protein